jgi:hypothetical protein
VGSVAVPIDHDPTQMRSVNDRRDVKEAKQEVDFLYIGLIRFEAPGYHRRVNAVNPFMLDDNYADEPLTD